MINIDNSVEFIIEVKYFVNDLCTGCILLYNAILNCYILTEL